MKPDIGGHLDRTSSQTIDFVIFFNELDFLLY